MNFHELIKKGESKILEFKKTLPSNEKVAIREAVINAFVHRDYSNHGRDIKVGIYDDVVNIVSPGGFPNTITQEDILKGRSEVRNKVIANVFKELSLIEQWGTGVAKMVAACKKHGLDEPAVIEKGDFVDVEFFRPQHELQQELQPQHELQHELQHESLYSIILEKLQAKELSTKELSKALQQKSIAGQLKKVIAVSF
ncbi:MAG TPA: hypothetical protein ENJ95_04545 [Bacteroidetes bacterium]|nr:hypothetical protein [Bacteroidota bacterium]